MMTMRFKNEMTKLEARESILRATMPIKMIDAYVGLEAVLNQLCAKYICDYFVACGISIVPGQHYTVDEVKSVLRVSEPYNKFIDYMLWILEEDNIIVVDQKMITVLLHHDDINHVTLGYRALIERYPEFQGLFIFLQHCVSHYPQALSERCSAIGVLYPSGNTSFIKQCLITDTVNHSYVSVYKRLVTEFLVSQLSNDLYQVLEIGAGSGDLTWQLAPFLVDKNINYTFTDIGRMFLYDAKRYAEAQGFSFMDFRYFDIRKDPAEQGYATNQFNLIVGLNVVHATNNIETSLTHLKSLLAPDGLLCLIETVKTPRWVSMIWGLAQGWWCFNDSLRVSNPMLDLPTWKSAFTTSGFGSVKVFPEAITQQKKTDTGLIVAQIGVL